MKKRIKELERRVEELEARPIPTYVPVPYYPNYHYPYWQYVPSVTYTIGGTSPNFATSGYVSTTSGDNPTTP